MLEKCKECMYDKEYGCCELKRWQCENNYSDADFIRLLLVCNRDKTKKLAAIAKLSDKSIHLASFVGTPEGRAAIASFENLKNSTKRQEEVMSFEN